MDIIDQLKFFRSLGVSHLDVKLKRRNGDKAAGSPALQAARLVEPTQAALRGSPPPPATLFVPTEPVTSPDQPRPSLEQIREELGDCRRCKLCSGRTNIVFGVGDPKADLMFVGEGPGADEDEQGIPFVGKAGQLLTRIIETMFEVARAQVYIANVVKCRPPGNRDPEPDEVAACERFLFQQIAAVEPLVIVALGRCAAQTMLHTTTSITAMRGKFVDYRGVPLLPTFHPSYLLRWPAKKREVFVDMKAVRAKLVELGSSYYQGSAPR